MVMVSLKEHLLVCDKQAKFFHVVIRVLVKQLHQMQHQLLDDQDTLRITELNAGRST